MEEILLGGEKFTAIEVVDLSEEGDLPSHSIEEGFEIADHIFHRPKEFKVELTLMQDEVLRLQELYEEKEPIDFVCGMGVFENCVIKDLHIKQGGSKNTFQAVVNLKQVRIAKSKQATVSLSKQLQVTPDEEDAPGGETATEPIIDGWASRMYREYQIKQASEADAYFHELEHGGKKQEDQKMGESKIDQISGFVAWLCGWDGD